jgi:hypothetical protein
MDKDKEQIIRDRAYRVWEDEGRPKGKEREHWECARREIQEEANMTEGHHDLESAPAEFHFRIQIKIAWQAY